MNLPYNAIGIVTAALSGCAILLSSISDNDVHYRDRTVPGADFSQASPGMMYVASGQESEVVPVCWYSGLDSTTISREPSQRLTYYNVLGTNIPHYASFVTVSMSREFDEHALPAGFMGRADPACEAAVTREVQLGRRVCVIDSVRAVPGREDVIAIRFKSDALSNFKSGKAQDCPLAKRRGFLGTVKWWLIAVRREAEPA